MQSTAILKQAQDMIPDMAEYDQASEEVSAVFTRFQKEDFEVNIKTALRNFYTHIFQEQEAMNEESQTLDTIIKEKDEFLQNAASLQVAFNQNFYLTKIMHGFLIMQLVHFCLSEIFCNRKHIPLIQYLYKFVLLQHSSFAIIERKGQYFGD